MSHKQAWGDVKVVPEVTNVKPSLSELRKLARTGDLKKLFHLITSKHESDDINRKHEDGSTPLHLAVKAGSLEGVKMLLSAGADIHMLDGNGRSALHLAARKGHLHILKELMQQPGAEVDTLADDGTTALFSAIAAGHYDICVWLINIGSDAFKADYSNQTPLMIAASEKHHQIVELIIATSKSKLGNNTSYLIHKDDEGSSAIHLAAGNNQIENVTLLLDSGVDVNYAKADGSAILHIASTYGFTKLLTILVSKYNADVNLRAQRDVCPIHKAADFNQRDSIAILVSNGAGLNVVDTSGATPLLYAARRNYPESFLYLLERGADIFHTDNNGDTSVHIMAHANSLSCINAFKEWDKKGNIAVLVNTRNNEDKTALHLAAQNGYTELVITLLELGSNPGYKDEQDKSPMHLASQHGHADCVEALYKYSKLEVNDGDINGRTPLLLACLSGHYEGVKVLLRLGGDVSAKSRDVTNHSALTLAAQQGNYDIVSLLLDNHADINDRTRYRDTALHLACRENHKGIVELLLTRSAMLDARNHSYQTPFDLAIENRSADAASVIISSERWQEAMNCLDKKNHNPLPKLIAYLPVVAEQVLDRCITLHGDPDSDEFCVTYNFEHLEIHPDQPKSGYGWYAKEMAELKRESLLKHRLVKESILRKQKGFPMVLFLLDVILYIGVLILMSVTIYTTPNYMNFPLDSDDCPMNLTTEEKQNQTLYNYYYQNGKPDGLSVEPSVLITMEYLSLISLIFVFIIAGRMFIALFVLKLYIFTLGSTYTNIGMIICLSVALLEMQDINREGEDIIRPILCLFQWRALWIGTLVAWSSLFTYITRIPVYGVYVLMLKDVLLNILKVLLSLMFILIAFGFCFFITMHTWVEYSEPTLSIWTVLSMALGEISFVSRFVEGSPLPFLVDNAILITLVMIILPIAFMNLLVGLAVGDIEAIRESMTISQITIKINTAYEYEHHMPKCLRRYWYKPRISEFPNRSNGIHKCVKSLKRFAYRAMYEETRGWRYKDSLISCSNDPELTNNTAPHEEIMLQKAKLSELMEKIDKQDEILAAIAKRLGI